ncbi:MAG: hypothetical protein KDA86_14565 [Planctomycetaceae bacterium]|nr:hypothetical protein [Planctomycetaceae bacterium]
MHLEQKVPQRQLRLNIVIALLILFVDVLPTTAAGESSKARHPADDDSLRSWLSNMVWYHRFSEEEITAATGLTSDELKAAKTRFGIRDDNAPDPPDDHVLVLPYPGGRHPRIGFLDGAIDPQRETKISVFTPWNDPHAVEADYVVADIPEAIWSNLGLTYLAHTHVPTVWTKQGITLEPTEWQDIGGGCLKMQRRLPNGIEFETLVIPETDHVRMRMSLTNGTDELLSNLRVQNCVMLKGAHGFTEQTNDNNLERAPYAARHDGSGSRWIITAWVPNHRTWANARCPCLHSDPQFEDCPPGETRRLEGWLSFYEGTDIDAEFDRIAASEWWKSD